jgi:hypothetical protein
MSANKKTYGEMINRVERLKLKLERCENGRIRPAIVGLLKSAENELARACGFNS